MRISDWSSDVCSSDLVVVGQALDAVVQLLELRKGRIDPDRGADDLLAETERVEDLSGRLADGDRAVWGRLEGYRLPAVGHGQGIGCRLGLGRGRGGGEEEGGKARVLKGHEVCLRIAEIRACGLLASKLDDGYRRAR